MNRSRRPRWSLPSARVAVDLLLLALCAACQHEPVQPGLFAPLASGREPPPVVLNAAPLGDEQVLRDWLASFVLLGGQEELPDLLSTMAASLRRADLAVSPAARRLAIEAVHAAVRTSDFAQRFDGVRQLVDNLHAAAPSSPEARFARAYLRLVLLADGQGGLSAAGIDRALIVDLHADLTALVEEHAGFVGPGEFTPAYLRKRRDEVALLLVTLPEAATPTALADPATPAAPAAPAEAAPAAPAAP